VDLAWVRRVAIAVSPDTGATPPPPALAVSPGLAVALDRLGELVEAFEQHRDPDVRQMAVEMLRCVDAVHRPGLRDAMALVRAEARLVGAHDRPDLQLLFELYDLDEGGERARANAVLDRVRPYIESHGGRLEVVEADAGVVKVRLTGSCAGCPGSSMTLRHVVEEALRSELGGFVRLEVLEPVPAGSVLPVTIVAGSEPRRLTWYAALHAADVPDGGVCSADVEGRPVLLLRLAGEIYAYRDACPPTDLPLSGGHVDDGTLVCPWHGCRFDGRSGRRLDRDGPDLGVMPIALEAGEVRLGVPPGTGA
jgi:Fe-S cluster biogenesis protein NfuA/nitrite reductase/ring-hydroxylating ferredoxin subunit